MIKDVNGKGLLMNGQEKLRHASLRRIGRELSELLSVFIVFGTLPLIINASYETRRGRKMRFNASQ